MIIDRFDFSGLTLDDRIILVQELWDSIHHEAATLPISEAQKAELDRRLALADAGEMEYVAWEDVKKRFTHGT